MFSMWLIRDRVCSRQVDLYTDTEENPLTEIFIIWSFYMMMILDYIYCNPFRIDPISFYFLQQVLHILVFLYTYMSFIINYKYIFIYIHVKDWYRYKQFFFRIYLFICVLNVRNIDIFSFLCYKTLKRKLLVGIRFISWALNISYKFFICEEKGIYHVIILQEIWKVTPEFWFSIDKLYIFIFRINLPINPWKD